MGTLTCAVVRFDGDNTASIAFADGRDRSPGNARWSKHIAIVEHHRHGHLLLRGMFAGHYLDVDESDHVSQKGAGEGAVAGGLIGVLAGPAGIAVGLVVGGIVGSKTGDPSDVEAEPQDLAARLREAIPRGSSAIVLFAPDDEVDEMLAALGDKAKDVARQSLSDQETAALEASLSGGAPGV
jgi:uncharacterized membrane protein